MQILPASPLLIGYTESELGKSEDIEYIELVKFQSQDMLFHFLGLSPGTHIRPAFADTLSIAP
jgi:hypothetical protein